LRRSLPTQIADALARQIITHELPPGEKLNEVEISTQWGVSRAPVREALLLLQQRGLVTMASQKGARVAALTLEELEQLFDIRASLFALAARKAALTRNGDKVARLKRLSRMLESGAETPERYAEASTEAALEIADLSDSPLLKDMLISFAERIA